MTEKDEGISATTLAVAGVAVIVGCVLIGLWGARRPRVEKDPMLLQGEPATTAPTRAPSMDEVTAPDAPLGEDGLPIAEVPTRPEFEVKEERQAETFVIDESGKLVLSDPNGEVVGTYSQLDLDRKVVGVNVDKARGAYTMDMVDGTRVTITAEIYEQLPNRFKYTRTEDKP